jgi:hypothetical protein
MRCLGEGATPPAIFAERDRILAQADEDNAARRKFFNGKGGSSFVSKTSSPWISTMRGPSWYQGFSARVEY